MYPTRIRGTGLGMASSFGRIGSIIMPIACTLLNNIGPLVPFQMFGGVALVSALFTFMLPFDTTGLAMDVLDKAWEKGMISRMCIDLLRVYTL